MKYCQKCGKALDDAAVICTGCGCPVTEGQEMYQQAVQCAALCNAISGILIALGIAGALWVNYWIGIVLTLAAEMIAVIPNTKVRSLLRQNNTFVTDKKQLKDAEKELREELKAKNTAYRYSTVFAIVALVCLIVFVLWSNALGI